MRNKKAKMLRRFASRFAAMQGLPDKSYTVTQHRNRTMFTGRLTADAEGNNVPETVVFETFQVLLDGCARKLYQIAKRTV